MRRTLFAVAGGAALAAAFFAAAVAPALADASISQIGWWSRNPVASAPEEGFAVAKAPDGDLTVAALGAFTSGEATKATLILTEAGSPVNAQGAALQVCYTPNEWTAGANQPWADRPKAECETGSAELKRNATSGTWAGDVLSVLSAADEDSTTISLMIVPAESAGAVGFEVKFASAELQVEEAEGDSFSGDFGGSDFSSDSSSDYSGGSDFSTDGSGGGSDFSTGSDFEPAPAPAAPTQETPAGSRPDRAPDVEPSEAEGEDTIGSGDFAISAARTGGDEAAGNTALQAVFFVAVALAAGAAAGFGRHVLRERLA